MTKEFRGDYQCLHCSHEQSVGDICLNCGEMDVISTFTPKEEEGDNTMSEKTVRPWFIESSQESFPYLRGDMIENHPVNLALCTRIEKLQYRWYPDNTGRPGIMFRGVGVHWAYKDEASRDADFERIANNEF